MYNGKGKVNINYQVTQQIDSSKNNPIILTLLCSYDVLTGLQ